ncbi:MAG: hypothetical protein HW412_847 [Bacteroidetes bacterium]|nr:hypothetical protein [Bacteroidota bacterium]
MPYCPKCGCEYVAGIKECPDCKASLLEGEQAFCDNCEEPIASESTFCQHCGVLLGWSAEGGEQITCDMHRGNDATGRCVVCKKVVCEECAVQKRGRYFCSDDKHVEMAFDWVKVYTTGTEYEAEMIAANLESAGIPARVYVQNDQMFVTTFGDLAVTKVMVPAEAADEAKHYIASLPLQESEDEPGV